MAITDEVTEQNRRLDIVIALLLRMLPKSGDTISLREQVQILSDLGMRPKDIAQALGRTPTYVNKELATIRKGKGSKR